MRRLTFLSVLLAAAAPVWSQVDTQALQRMVSTERAFAAATEHLGVRDGFLTFFAPDAVSIEGGASGSAVRLRSAREGLLAQSLPKLPLANHLMWEPFTGQVSADGALGWLTGAYVVQNQATRAVVGQGAYFSVWKRQTDGTWRVWLDEGISLPQLWLDASPFRVAPDPDPGAAGTSGERIEDVERAVAGSGDAWAARLAASARVHRDGLMPLVGREAILAWSAGLSRPRYTVVSVERAASGDLAITIGGYDTTAADGPQHGTWVRVWKRDLGDRWRIVFETSKQGQ